MTVETEMLATLKSIEKLLHKSTATVSQERTEASTQTSKNRNTRGRGDDVEDLKDSARDASKKLDEFEKSTRVASRAVRMGLTSTASSFKSLNTAIGKAISTLSSLNVDKKGAATADNAQLMGRFGRALEFSTEGLSGLYKASKQLKGAFGKLIGANKDSTKSTKESTKATTRNSKATEKDADIRDDSSRRINKSGTFLEWTLNRMGIQVKDAGEETQRFSENLQTLESQLKTAFSDLISDVFLVQARGISAADSLGELYGNSIKAGMSLREYTEMLEENSAAVVRAGSFSEFGDSLDRTTRQLNVLGSFGPTAEKLAASLQNTNVVLGVSQGTQQDAIAAQVKLFGRLRKSTLMTADGFRQLQEDVASNQYVQEELLGLAPRERAARMQQIMQSATIGHQLGLTAKASKDLQEALLAQRGATVEDRFKAAGTIRMGGAILGMDTSRVEEYARIMMKNPAARTKEENDRAVALAGDYQKFLQRLKSSSNPALENIADKLGQIQPEVQAGLQKAAGQAVAQTEAGKVANAETGQQASGFMQQMGSFLTAFSGFMKNPFGQAAVTLGSILVQTVVQSTLLGMIAKNTGSFKGLGSMFQGLKGKLGGIFGKKKTGAPTGMLASFGEFFADTLGSTMGIDLGTDEAKERRRNKRALEKVRLDELKFQRKKERLTGIKYEGVAKKPDMIASMISKITPNMNIPITPSAGDVMGGLGKTAATTVPEAAKKGIMSSIFGGIKGAFSSIFGSGSFLGNIGSTIFNLAKGFFKKLPIISALVSGIEEMFTGNMTAGLGFDDGFWSRIGGSLFAGVNGLFTGFTRMIDGAFDWAMEGLGFETRSVLTNWVDIATLSISSGIQLLGTAFMEHFHNMAAWIKEKLADAISFFVGEKAPWVKKLREGANQSREAAKKSDEKHFEILDDFGKRRELLDQKNAEGGWNTLRDIGAKEQKIRKEEGEKAVATIKDNSDKVVNGLGNLVGAVKSTADSMVTGQATTGSSGQTVTGTPQPTRTSQVNGPEVNTAANTANNRTTRDDDGSKIAGMQRLIQTAELQLEMLRKIAGYEAVMAAAATAPEDESTSALLTRPTFTDATLMNNQIIAA